MINQKERNEKWIRAIVRECDCLRPRIWNPPLKKLEKPYQRGWVRFYVLGEGSGQRGDKSVLNEILPHINSIRYCNRPDFKKRKGRSKKMIEIDQPLRTISIWEWKRRQLPESWKLYFRFIGGRHEYEFIHPWLFELRIEKHWITHYKEVDPLVLERFAELQSKMEHNQFWRVFDRLKGRHYWKYDPRWKIREREAKKEIRTILLSQEAVEMLSLKLARASQPPFCAVILIIRSCSSMYRAPGFEPGGCRRNSC